MTIDGQNLVTFNEANLTRTFVSARDSGSHQRMWLMNGNAGAGNGGAVLNNGTLTLISATFANNCGTNGGAVVVVII